MGDFHKEAFSLANRMYCDTVNQIGVSDQSVIAHANTVMYGISQLGFAFLLHFEGGSGFNLEIPTEGIIENDEGVKRNITSELSGHISAGSGVIGNPQSVYTTFDYQLAFGSLNFQWRAVSKINDDVKDVYMVDLWFVNRYRWHATAARVSQCMHAAFTRSPGREYDMIGKRVFYVFVKYKTGRADLLYPNQNTPYLTRLRQLNPPAGYIAIPVTTAYPDTTDSFSADVNTAFTGASQSSSDSDSGNY